MTSTLYYQERKKSVKDKRKFEPVGGKIFRRTTGFRIYETKTRLFGRTYIKICRIYELISKMKWIDREGDLIPEELLFPTQKVEIYGTTIVSRIMSPPWVIYGLVYTYMCITWNIVSEWWNITFVIFLFWTVFRDCKFNVILKKSFLLLDFF